MPAIVCTLFEGHYQNGVASFINSLHKKGFRGDVYAGYRGEIPFWVDQKKVIPTHYCKNAVSLELVDGISIHFVKLETNYHLTNYKPDFLLDVIKMHPNKFDCIFYFDPDILLNATWQTYLNWIECGVALSEDVNSPISEFHPRRVAWRKYFLQHGIHLKFRNSIYVNGGFVGLTIDNKEFLILWKKIQEAMAPAIGGLNRSAFIGSDALLEAESGSFSPFGKTDQDALNASVEAWDGCVSLIGLDGMGFREGDALMLHALGQPKPWKKNILKSLMSGHPPNSCDKAYWQNVSTPIRLKPNMHIKLKGLQLLAASFIGRFYNNN